MVVNCASDKRYDATASAYVEVSGARPKSVLREERLVTNLNDEFRVAMGGPSSSVLDAKSAAADPDRDLRSIARPTQPEANVSAVALAFDPHETAPERLALQGTAQLLANSTKGGNARCVLRSYKHSADVRTHGRTLYLPIGARCVVHVASLPLDGSCLTRGPIVGVLIGGRYDQVSYRSCLGVGVRVGRHGPGAAIGSR